MVRYVLEDGGDVYLSDLDGACTAERVRETNCLESGCMIAGKVAQRAESCGQIGILGLGQLPDTNGKEEQSNHISRKAIVRARGYDTDLLCAVMQPRI